MQYFFLLLCLRISSKTSPFYKTFKSLNKILPYFVKKVKGYSPDDTYTMANYFVPKTVTYLPTCERAMTYFMINLANVNEILTNGVLNENYKDNGNVLKYATWSP